MSSIPKSFAWWRLRIVWRRLKYADWSELALNALVFIAWVFLGTVAILGLLP